MDLAGFLSVPLPDSAGLFLAVLVVAGLGAGFVGGLFGIGGGVIIAPVLYGLFGVYGVDAAVRLPLAIGTSLAVIIVTAARSLGAHKKSGEVDETLLRGWLPWIALGAAGSGFVAAVIPKSLLLLVFAGGAFYVGWSRIFGQAKAARSHEDGDITTSSQAGWAERYTAILGAATGFFASLLGLGGGAAGVVIMGWTGRSVHRAVATASGFGLGVAIPGALGFMIAGWGHAALPMGSVGFVSLPAFMLLSAMTAITAPFGARLAHRINGKILSRLFGGYILLVSLLMVREALI